MGNYKEIKARQAQKHDIEANWEKAGENGFVPVAGEIIIYDKDATHLKDRIKIGDGVTKISDLDFISSSGRDIRVSVLSNTEKARISSINTTTKAEKFLTSHHFVTSNNLSGFSSWIYEQAGIDFNGYVDTIQNTFELNFNWPNCQLLTEKQANSYARAMLVPNSYGGSGENMKNNPYSYNLNLEDYQIGDIFCSRYHDESLPEGKSKNAGYYIAIYLGDNKFLIYNDFGLDENKEQVAPSVIKSIEDHEWITQFTSWTSDDQIFPIYFYVLRPQNLAHMDINKIKLRDIATGGLTDLEEAAFSNLPLNDSVGKQLPQGAIWAYKYAGIDVSPYFKEFKISGIKNKLFNEDYDFLGYNVPVFGTMLVQNSWGGSKFTDNKPSYTIAIDEFQIGDIFCGAFPGDGGTGYWAIIYMGNKKFCVVDSSDTLQPWLLEIEKDEDLYEEKDWIYYYVLRPQRLATKDVKRQEQVEELNSEIESLSLKKADTTRAKEGIQIVSSDCGVTPLKELNIYGKTTQNGIPAPDAPVDLKNIGEDEGNIGVTVCGKNLVKSWTNAEKTTTQLPALYIDFDMKPNTKYVISFVGSTDHQVYGNKEIFSPNVGSFSMTGERQSIVFTVGSTLDKQDDKQYASGKGWIIFKNTNDQSALTKFTDVQIELAESATEYEPYNGTTVTVPTPNGLSGIPVSSGGNYTDANGQQWYSDEIDFARNKLIERVKRITFDGNEGWKPQDDKEWIICQCIPKDVAASTQEAVPDIFCTHLKPTERRNISNGTKEGITITRDGFVCIYIGDSYVSEGTTRAEAVSQFLEDKYNEGNPVVLYCKNPEPVETFLDSETLIQFRDLHTFSPVTTILNDAGAHMGAVYYTHSTAVPMVFTPEDRGKILSIDNDGCVNIGGNLEELESRVTKTSNEIFGKLTEEQKDILSKLTVNDIKNKFSAPYSFINHIYSKIGRSFILSTDLVQDFVLVNKRHIEMCIASYTASSTSGNKSSPTNSNIFQIGDIFLGRHNTDTSRFYIMAVYIGNNTWLHTRQNVADPKVFEGNITEGIEGYQNWTYYGVYRPELKLLNVSGLGSETVQQVDPDTTFATGWYGAFITNVNGISSTIKGLLHVESIDGKNKIQTFTQIIGQSDKKVTYTIRRATNNLDGWGPWYWLDETKGPKNKELITAEMSSRGQHRLRAINTYVSIAASGTKIANETGATTNLTANPTVCNYFCIHNSQIKKLSLSISQGEIKIEITSTPDAVGTGTNVAVPITIWYY